MLLDPDACHPNPRFVCIDIALMCVQIVKTKGRSAPAQRHYLVTFGLSRPGIERGVRGREQGQTPILCTLTSSNYLRPLAEASLSDPAPRNIFSS